MTEPDAGPWPDPYLSWAALNRWHDPGADPSRTRVSVAIECAGTVADLLALVDRGALPGVHVAAAYRGPAVDPRRIRFCTATVDIAALPVLEPRIRRLKLGLAVAAEPGHSPQARSPAPAAGATRRVVVGLIDDFVAFDHPLFRDRAGRSRVRHVWCQDEARPACRAPQAWQAVAGWPYGHELDTRGVAAAGIALADAVPVVRPRMTHGTAVAALAAGSADRGARLPDLIAVQLPRRGIADTSGRALKVHALDALHYILARADPEARVVVNISLGTLAGAHDGGSILEQAIDELIELRAGRLAVVVPAGNGYESRCHAVVRLDRDHRDATLQWLVPPADATPSFVEIWLPEGAAAAALRVALVDPTGRTRLDCGRGEVQARPPAGRPACALVFHPRVADSAAGTMVLAALAPTAPRDGGPAAEAGVWHIELRGPAGADIGDVHAWIERDDSLPGRPSGGRQSRFVDAAYEPPRRRPGPPPRDGTSAVRRDGTLNSIACGRHVIVVGGCRARDGRVADDSAGGPTRRPRPARDPGGGGGDGRRPLLLAPSDETATQPGLRVPGTRGVDCTRLRGTSVAAPQVAREIAAWLARAGPKGLAPQALLARIIRRLRRHRGSVEREGVGWWPTSAPATPAPAPAPAPAPPRSRRARGPSAAG